jgi:topoisomerase-4 subunit A
MEDEKLRKKLIATELQDIRKKFGKDTDLGARRTEYADAPIAKVIDIQAFVESEPITILCSEKGWLRALKGYRDDLEDIKYKEGDAERFVLKAKTTDKLLVFTSNGKFFTIGCDKLPSGKGFGEPLTVLVDLAQNEEVQDLLLHKAGAKILVATASSKGFIAFVLFFQR